MYEDKYKIVDYDLYCPECQHWDAPSTDDPCDECLRECTNLNSHRPINFKEKEGKQ